MNNFCSSIPTNTAIASFSGNGGTTYDGNNGHAGIFLYCESDGSIRVSFIKSFNWTRISFKVDDDDDEDE